VWIARSKYSNRTYLCHYAAHYYLTSLNPPLLTNGFTKLIDNKFSWVPSFGHCMHACMHRQFSQRSPRKSCGILQESCIICRRILLDFYTGTGPAPTQLQFVLTKKSNHFMQNFPGLLKRSWRSWLIIVVWFFLQIYSFLGRMTCTLLDIYAW